MTGDAPTVTEGYVCSAWVNDGIRYTVTNEGHIPYAPYYFLPYLVARETRVTHEALDGDFIWWPFLHCGRFTDRESAVDLAEDLAYMEREGESLWLGA